MELDENDSILIDRYLDGSLSSTEVATLERRMAVDNAYANAVEWHKDLVMALRANGRKLLQEQLIGIETEVIRAGILEGYVPTKNGKGKLKNPGKGGAGITLIVIAVIAIAIVMAVVFAYSNLVVTEGDIENKVASETVAPRIVSSDVELIMVPIYCLEGYYLGDYVDTLSVGDGRFKAERTNDSTLVVVDSTSGRIGTLNLASYQHVDSIPCKIDQHAVYPNHYKVWQDTLYLYGSFLEERLSLSEHLVWSKTNEGNVDLFLHYGGLTYEIEQLQPEISPLQLLEEPLPKADSLSSNIEQSNGEVEESKSEPTVNQEHSENDVIDKGTLPPELEQ